MRLCDFIMENIVKREVKDIFAFVGGGMMYLADAMGKNKDITPHFYHHEQAAGIAAEAYARISGKPGFCFVTSGPGGLNAVEAIAECWQDSVPVIFIIGQNKTSDTTRNSGIEGLRQYGPTEIDLVPVLSSITKKTICVTDDMNFPTLFNDMITLATDCRPGPIAIIIPIDMQKKEVRLYNDVLLMKEFTKDLRKSKRPLIIAGQGVRISNQERELLYFAATWQIPIVTTHAGADLIEYDNPLYVGHPGMKGDRAGNIAVQNADFIISIGASLHTFTTGYNLDDFAPEAKIYYVEPDNTLIRRCKLKNVVPINCSIEQFFVYEYFGSESTEKSDEWRLKCKTWKKEYQVYNEPHAEEPGRINIYKALQIVNEASKEGDIIISDAGSAYYAVSQAWQFKKGQRSICSNALGTMGWAIPAAIGAAIANKDARILCFTGDGSFATSLAAVPNLAMHGNIKVFVFENNAYLSIRNTQDTFFNGNYVGVDEEHGLAMADMEEICDATGIYYNDFDEEDIEHLSWLLKQDAVYITSILTNIKQDIIPTIKSYVDANGKFVSGKLENMYPYLEEK
jgi:acetolactate synthase-1/2/3 large subunit